MQASTPSWDDFRNAFTICRETEVSLDTSRLGWERAWIESRGEDVGRAFADMRALEGGAIANPDEGRQVGHYWLRAEALAPEALRETIRSTRERVIAFAEAVHRAEIAPPGKARFRHALLIGIGGSALGPQLLSDALARATDPMALHFLDNTDPDGFQRVLGALGDDLAETLTVVVSKSGGTKETRNGMLAAMDAYRALGLEFAKHAVAVTGDDSLLDRLAREEGWIERFPIWDWVGGRTSLMSAVGLLPAALQGIDIRALLDGAAAMDRTTRCGDVDQNPAMLMSLAWFHAGKGKGERNVVVLPYRDRLLLLSRYLQQLVMESLGKELDLDGKAVFQGLSVYGNKGSTDQHAFVQQLRDGRDDFLCVFVHARHSRDADTLEVEDGITSGDYLNGFYLGTREALTARRRPSLSIGLERVDARSLGALIALFERAVSFYASLIHVNAYHQPGVEAGKKAATRVIELQRRVMTLLRESARSFTVTECAAALAAPDDTETMFHLLRHLSATGRVVASASDDPFAVTYRASGHAS